MQTIAGHTPFYSKVARQMTGIALFTYTGYGKIRLQSQTLSKCLESMQPFTWKTSWRVRTGMQILGLNLPLMVIKVQQSLLMGMCSLPHPTGDSWGSLARETAEVGWEAQFMSKSCEHSRDNPASVSLNKRRLVKLLWKALFILWCCWVSPMTCSKFSGC